MPLPTDDDVIEAFEKRIRKALVEDDEREYEAPRLTGNHPIKVVCPPGQVTTGGNGIVAVDQRVYLGTLGNGTIPISSGGTGWTTASSAKQNLADRLNAVVLRFPKWSQARECCEDYGLDKNDITRDPEIPERGRRLIYQVMVPLNIYNAPINPEDRTKEWLKFAAKLKNRRKQIESEGGYWIPAYLSTTGQKEWQSYVFPENSEDLVETLK